MKKLLIAVLALVIASVAAFAGGLFSNFPIVGGAAYCESTQNSTCVSTIPAGPTATTGNETILASTNLASGANPQNVLMSMRALRAAPMTYTLCAAAACGSVTVGNASGGILFDYSTTIDSATVVLPASPMDGMRVEIASPYTITSLTVSAGAGTSLAVSTPTVLTASTTAPQGYSFQYVASTTKWYRIR